MKNIPLMLINVIILLTSLRAPIIAARGRAGGGGGGGGGFVGGGGGFGGGGFMGGAGDSGASRSSGIVPGTKRPTPDGSSSGYMGGNPGGKNTGYRGGIENGKPRGGGDGGAALVVIPKKPVAAAKMPMPLTCKPEVINCINTHIYGTAGQPQRYGACCTKLRHAVPCVCKFLSAMDPKLSNNANGVLRGCHFSKPKCPKMPMPQECRPEVRQCVNTHIYGNAGVPQHRGSCCLKLQHSKKCVCKFLASQDSTLINPANGVLRGCRFTKTSCPKV